MIGYLTAIASRDLLPSMRESRSESELRHTDSTTPITPRLPSEYETWQIPAFEESAEEKGQTADVEQTVTSPTIDRAADIAAIRVRRPRRVEVNPSAEPHASQPESPAPLSRAISSQSKTGHESSATATQPARRNTGAPTQAFVPPTAQHGHEKVAARALSKPHADVAKTESESPPRSYRRIAEGIDRARAVKPSPLILPQIRESVSINHVESHARQRESSTTQKSEPSIVVTIGRIEVRAVTSAAQSRPQPERQPMMSLDDYLKQRVRGVR